MSRPAFYKLSIVIPVLNEVACLGRLLGEIEQHVEGAVPDYEILFIDDHSTDGTFETIREFAKRNQRVRCIGLSRNMGHQAALACGLAAATGDVVITMDGDLQHPPSFIPEMIDHWLHGYDVVNTVRENDEEGARVGRWLSRGFYFLFNRLGEVKLVPGSPDFRLLDRRCVDALNAMREHLKFYRGMVSYIGFRQITLAFRCPPRFAGTRSYTLRQSLRMASDGILSFSTVGLKIPFLLGLIVLCLVLGYFAYSGVLSALGRAPLLRGWTSLAALIFLSMGLQLTSIGVFGLYLGKMFVELKARPLYFIGRTIGFDERAPEPQPGAARADARADGAPPQGG